MTQEIQTTSRSRSLLNINTIDDAIRASEMLSKSGLVPDKFKGKPADILTAMQWGAELGSVQPLQALNGIAVVNGTPSIYGDLGKALVMRQADLANFSLDTRGEGRSMEAVCEIVRMKPHGKIGVVRTFSMADAERGGLASRGPWKQYPARMLMWRAFWLAARDIYADVLSGLQGAEELEDLPHEIKAQSSAPPAPPKVTVEAAAKPERSADDKEARFTGEDAPKSPEVTKEKLISMIGSMKAELRLEREEFIEIARSVGVDYDGGMPKGLSLDDLRTILGALHDEKAKADRRADADDDADIPF